MPGIDKTTALGASAAKPSIAAASDAPVTVSTRVFFTSTFSIACVNIALLAVVVAMAIGGTPGVTTTGLNAGNPGAVVGTVEGTTTGNS